MASRVNCTFLLGLLCFALVLSSGVTDYEIPGRVCLKGDCGSNSQCQQRCVKSGYPKGGTCIAFIPGILLCCCFK
ncbi:hypothetical protein VNO78_15884 [Psophocarpus tetragonolobus]|uniref:Uncharacterized protein n=1 Tax=Psophocarpus tetragonolobus TaxID=3891 RepID=A0AAN9SJY3_PSOTE